MFSQSRIKIGNEYHDLHSRPGGEQWCRRVVLQGDVIVPARSEVDVPVRVVLRSLSGDYAGDLSRYVSWSTEPMSMSAGVYVSRTIIPSDRLIDIPVRIVNVHLKRERLLTIFSRSQNWIPSQQMNLSGHMVLKQRDHHA